MGLCDSDCVKWCNCGNRVSRLVLKLDMGEKLFLFMDEMGEGGCFICMMVYFI